LSQFFKKPANTTTTTTKPHQMSSSSSTLESQLIKAFSAEGQGQKFKTLCLNDLYKDMGFESYLHALAAAKKVSPFVQEHVHWEETGVCYISASLLAAMAYQQLKYSTFLTSDQHAELFEVVDFYCEYVHVPRDDILGCGGYDIKQKQGQEVPHQPKEQAAKKHWLVLYVQ
jgi:hypothetical protein